MGAAGVRTHADAAALGLWAYGEAERAIARPERIAVVRFELVAREDAATGWLDIVFGNERIRTVLAGVYVDAIAAAGNDDGALIFPRAARALVDDAAAAGLAAFLVPQIRSLTRAWATPFEHIFRFAACPEFDRARDAGFYGAAPLDRSLGAIAPWLAAERNSATVRAIHEHETRVSASVEATMPRLLAVRMRAAAPFIAVRRAWPMCRSSGGKSASTTCNAKRSCFAANERTRAAVSSVHPFAKTTTS